MMVNNILLAALAAAPVAAFPWVAAQAGVDSSIIHAKRQQPGSAATCPYNSNHPGAVPINSKYPYCGAINGKPGNQTCTNNQVPAKGDTAHAWEPAGKNDIRGPCPGLNTAANHHFLSHDGITTFNELVDMQQNVYGVGYDLAVLLAVFGVELDGDIPTQRLSIGCDASTRTSSTGSSTPAELGLDGHNKFEGDTSLTRNDYFLGKGDNYMFNTTLFAMMSATCKGNFGLNNIALYRYQRYQQSRHDNPNFYFGPKSVLLYGAASFLYELFPSLGEKGAPDQNTQNYFFIREQLPPNWFSRVDPYTIPLVANEIFKQYSLYPVEFGGNTGGTNGMSFVGLGPFGPTIGNNSMYNGNAAGISCLLYQIATEDVPSSVGGGGTGTPADNFRFGASRLNPLFSSGTLGSFGCPLNFNNA